ncbi:hypothetical protein HAX54_044793 [Datura stramonium]|uniref:Uncharacterized protein n=1 Tax=Datura stramonium TaxID=4076 RepID=A0ABS8WF36_DATST|nr:hypothetical protein [Datura stramonium]
MDKATTTKNRPTTAKLRVQIDLAKPLLHMVSVEVRNHCGKMDLSIALAAKFKELHRRQTNYTNYEQKRNMDQPMPENTMARGEEITIQTNKNDNWQNVDGRRGKGIDHNGAQRGENQNKNNTGTETCSDKPDSGETAPIRIWKNRIIPRIFKNRKEAKDETKLKKESGKINKQQAELRIRSTRSRTIGNSSNIDIDLQREMVSLVIEVPTDIKGLQNKRKKFDKTVALNFLIFFSE